MSLREITLYHLLQHNARVYASQPALLTGEVEVTHSEFLERVNRLAAGMINHGIEKGDRVCILAQNSMEYLELYGACSKTGAIAYPINWRLTPKEVSQVFNLAAPAMLVVGIEHVPQTVDLDISGVKVRATLGEGAENGYLRFSELYDDSLEMVTVVQSDDPFVIISTAAVDGVPKGAVLTHRNLIMSGYATIAKLGLGAMDRHLAALPFFHITGLGLSLAVNQAGGANVVMESFDAAVASTLIDRLQVTVMADFPPILSLLLDAREDSSGGWSSLRMVLGLDAPDVIQRLHADTDAKFWTGFGQSETSGVATLAAVEEKPGSAGQPLSIAQIRTVDHMDKDVPLGEPGEIVARGPMVFTGYWQDPDATAYALRNDWHHTGDIGSLDSDGYLYYVGRMPEKELVKSGGENIYPAEVEHVLQSLTAVEAVCVIGVPDSEWGESIKAVVVFAPGESLTEEEIRTSVADRIASFKKPRFIEIVEDLPRQENGEIDRVAAKE